MEIQEHLLLEQLKAVSGSPLSRILMQGQRPGTIDEFRQQVPLTTYSDYQPYIGNCQEEFLPQKPAHWARTSGKGGQPKWVPYTQEALDLVITIGIASLILASASRRGEVRVSSGVRVMQNLAPPPYFSGVVGQLMDHDGCIRMVPPFDQYKNASFEKRMQDGFKMALRSPIEVLGSLTAVLVKMGESFAENQGRLKLTPDLLSPRVLLRLLVSYARSKSQHRPILPRDLWPLKGLICYGMDTSAYRQQLKYYWGREPLEIYSATECTMLALQSWNKKGLTFVPFSGFLEFIPESEWLKNRQNPDYHPQTILLDELRAGNLYEVVFSSFHGMPFLRYRLGDLIRVSALEDTETGSRLPQVIFQCRGDDVIDINGFARLDEKTLWRAITAAGVDLVGWSARKEFVRNKPFVHIYAEPKNGADISNLGYRIHTELLDIHKDYKDARDMLGLLPVEVTRLSKGSFQRYYESRARAGAEISHLKPPQMNALDRDIEEFLVLSNQGDQSSK